MGRKPSKERANARTALYEQIRKVHEGPKLWGALFELAEPRLEENSAKDRAAAIMSAVFLEHALKEAISRCLRPDPKAPEFEYLFYNDEAPYREFAGRLRLARALGIIDQGIFDQLEAIRLIRNGFAHSMEDISFKTEAIVKLFNQITIVHADASLAKWIDVFAPKYTLLGSLPETRSSRTAFVFAVSQFFVQLMLWYPSNDGPIKVPPLSLPEP